MSTKHVIVVDTVGNPDNLSSTYKDNYPFVSEWKGYEATDNAGLVPHPHGGMCMHAALLPLWNCTEPVIAHFIRIFDSNGRVIPDAFDEWAINTIRDIAEQGGELYVNNSWGNYIANGDTSRFESIADIWRRLIDDTGATIMWASGNSGDFDPDVDEEMPQGLLVDVSSKIAASDRDSKPSSYSGDSVNAPPAATFWSTRIHLLNPVTANWDVASGTSFAAPKATGLCAKRRLNYHQFIELAKQKGLRPSNYAGMLPHPKWGWGWLEEEYQQEIEGCPYKYESGVNGINALSLEDANLVWFDFELRQSNKIGDIA